jgi:hypothetical protein
MADSSWINIILSRKPLSESIPNKKDHDFFFELPDNTDVLQLLCWLGHDLLLNFWSGKHEELLKIDVFDKKFQPMYYDPYTPLFALLLQIEPICLWLQFLSKQALTIRQTILVHLPDFLLTNNQKQELLDMTYDVRVKFLLSLSH